MLFRIQFIFILQLITGVFNAQIYTGALQLKLDSILSGNENEPGGSIYIQQGNQILYTRSFGLSDLTTGQKFSDLTVSNIGGISKVFIAYSILILQEQGKLSIEDSLFKYFPEIKNKELAQKIKIRHLLTHTSGLKDLPHSQMDSLFSLTMKDQQNFELVKYSNTLAFEPGNNFHYSDEAFSALVLIIEKVSKMKWQKFIKQHIFTPSSMTYSKLTENSEITGRAAHGYRFLNNTYSEYDQGECPKMYTATNAGVWCNIEDFKKFMYGLKYCLFLKCETIKLSEQVLLPWNWYSPQPPAHTYCWFANASRFNNKDARIESLGDIGGFRSGIIYFPEKDLMILLLSNNSRDYSQMVLTQLSNLNFIK